MIPSSQMGVVIKKIIRESTNKSVHTRPGYVRKDIKECLTPTKEVNQSFIII